MKNTTKGFYSLEAAIVLPFIILAVLSLGYYIKVEGTWENCIHGAVDESVNAAAYSYETGMAIISKNHIEKRLAGENPNLDKIRISNVRTGYSDFKVDKLTSYHIDAIVKLELPLGFDHEFNFSSGIKFRGFVGRKQNDNPLGSEGLEKDMPGDPVWVFPQTGEKYHDENCTYVKASVRQEILTHRIKAKYKECKLCESEKIPAGSIVFCFESEGTSYHRGSCGSVNRHTIIIDKNEAIKKGYEKCSKCGGG